MWTSSPLDATNMGGPKAAKLAGRAGFDLTSVRHFVYGPGEGGITIEYLYSDRDANRLLLSRPGNVVNLGGNIFQMDYTEPLKEFEVTTDARSGAEKLATGVALEAGADRMPPVSALRARTTYLSERLWIVRSLADDSVSVFERTSTRSVMDRRGLVAEGQLKPPEDETIRYGGLLFGETLQDYAGWEDKQTDGTRDKILSR